MIDLVFPAAVGVVALLFAAYLTYWILKKDAGNEKMQEIAKAIQEGANAFLKKQYITLLPFVVVLFAIIYYFLGMSMAAAFLVGVVASGLAGLIGMTVSVRANVRTAQAASKGLKDALTMAFRGGEVTGLALVGLGLIGISGLLFVFNGDIMPLIGFGFGASLISLFARVGGGIYTKAADVGADIVGKVEKGIPEDDPRNPAVIADNVGDNVGDCAGMAADLFESFSVTMIAAMLLGKALGEWFVGLPLQLAAVAVIATIIGALFARLDSKNNIMGALYKGLLATSVLSLAGFYMLLQNNLALFGVTVVGVVASIAIFIVTDYYTSKERKPVAEVANAAKTGAGTNVIKGIAVGLQSTAPVMLVTIIAIIVAFKLAGVFGIALAAAAMLSLTGIIITLDAYGPITDNAGGIAEMSGLPEEVREVTDALDAIGNTTKATTKGFAIAGAALGALALFAAYSEASKLTTINLFDTAVVVGLFIGALLPFVFSSFLMNAVGNAAFEIVEEVRRQFREKKGLMKGTEKPDYAQCVSISTGAALKELMVPGLIAVLSPIIVGALFGAAALGGLLAGAISTGFLLAVFMSNTGATWDNSKKYIESGQLAGEKKGTEAHKAAVVGDTVGDPFKDTAGPALNALIKVLNTVALLAVAALGAALIAL